MAVEREREIIADGEDKIRVEAQQRNQRHEVVNQSHRFEGDLQRFSNALATSDDRRLEFSERKFNVKEGRRQQKWVDKADDRAKREGHAPRRDEIREGEAR